MALVSAALVRISISPEIRHFCGYKERSQDRCSSGRSSGGAVDAFPFKKGLTDTVRLERASFLLTSDASVGTNLYKSGMAHFTNMTLPPYVARALSGKRDLVATQAFGTMFPCFNVQRPPFDNVLLRYAFNMATDQPDARVELKPGDPAPDFSLPGSDGRTYRLKELAVQPVVIAWFPKAFTGG